MEETKDTVATIGMPAPAPAVSSDSVVNYLQQVAGVLSAIVVDMNNQITNVKKLQETMPNGESDAN
jgi:hypothetical protein